MEVNNNSNLINQICTVSGLSGKALEDLKTRLAKMSETELQAELTKAIAGNNFTRDMGLVVERTFTLPQAKPVQPQQYQPQTRILKEKQCKEVACQIIDENLRDAAEVFQSQHLGSISGAYDNAKAENDKLKTSNIAKVIDYQQAGFIQIIEAKNQNLTKRQYYEENKQRIKDMILTRLNVLKTPSGASYIDSFRGKYSKEKMTEIINAYVERLCSDASIEKLKDIQLQFVSYNQVEEAEALSNFVKNAQDFQENWRDTTINTLGNEGKPRTLKGTDKGIIPSYLDSDKPISFEEVYKLERGAEYSQYEVEKYVQAKTEMETVIHAFNKKQQFIDFTEALRKEELTFSEKEEKLLAGFAEFYALSEDGGLSQLQKIIDKSRLPIAIKNGKFDLAAFPDDASKNRILNQLLKLAGQEKEKDFKAFLDDKTLEEYQLSFEETANDVLGEENSKLLADAMVNDNMGMIKRYTGNASMAGMALTVVGGILCFTPAAPLGAVMVTAGNTVAIGGMVAKTGLGVADYATKDVQTQEELEGLAKDFIMDAGGFIIGMKAGQAGMKAFNKLIDQKLVAVFGQQISQGNKLQALKTVFANPEYLKSFTKAAGTKISTDFLISYMGDLAMMGTLDTQDDWKSLLQANLTGILVGMSGDIKDVAGVGKGAVKSNIQPNARLELNLPKGALTSEAEAQWLERAKTTNPAENAEKRILSEVAKTEFVDKGMRLNTAESLDAELDFAMKNSDTPVENLETLSLVISGKLGEMLKSQYDRAGKIFSELMTKNADKISKIEQKYANDKQKLAEEFTHILADELGVSGIEPKIEIVKTKDENADGYFDWTQGKLLISEKITNPKDIETIIAHEFVHVMQFKDIVAAKGQDGVREIIMKNNDGKYIQTKTKEFLEDNGLNYDLETPEDQAMYVEAVANQIAENILEANAGLRDFAQKHPLEKGSLNEYLARIYKSENENMAAFETEAYYKQVIENEAYYLGNGKLGTEIKGQLSIKDIITKSDTGKDTQKNADGLTLPAGTVLNNLHLGRAERAKNEMISILSNITIKTLNGKELKLPTAQIQKFADLVKNTHTAKVLSEYLNKYKDDSFQANKIMNMLTKLKTPEDIETFVDIIESPKIGEILKTPDSLFMRADMNSRGIDRTSVEYLEKVTEAGLDKPRGGKGPINFEEIDSIMRCKPEQREILSKIYKSKLFSRIEFYKLFEMDPSELDLTNLDRIDSMIDGYKWCDSMSVNDAKYLLEASEEVLSTIDSRNLLKTIPNREKHLTGLEALELARVDDATWAKIQERGLLQDFYESEIDNHLPVDMVREVASLPENLWKNIQSRSLLVIRPNGNDNVKNLYNTPDFIRRVASLTDESYSKFKEQIENPTDEIILLNTIMKNSEIKPGHRRGVLSQNRAAESSLPQDAQLFEIDENVFNQLKSLKTIFGDYVSTEETARVADILFLGKKFDNETCEVLKDFIKDIQQYSDERLLCQHEIFEIFDSIVDNPYMGDISRPREGVITLHGLFRFLENSKASLANIEAQKEIFESIKNNEFGINRADNLKILKFVNKNNVESIKTLLNNKNLSSENLTRLIQQNTGDYLTWITSQDIEPALSKLEAQRQKVEEKPELYINGEANDEASISHEIGKIFDKKYAKMLTLCTIYDKEAINNLLRMRIDDAEEYLYTMDSFSTKEFGLLKGLTESTNIDGKPFMPTQKIEFIDLLNAYKENNLEMTKIEEMVKSGKIDLAQLHIDLFNQIMKDSGLTDEEIASIPKEKLVAWDTKYAHLLSKEINVENDVAFSDVLRAGNLAPDFNQYIHDTSNVYGQANAETRSRYNELGMNYDKWVKPAKENEVRSVSKDANTEQLQQVAAQITEDMNTLMQTPVKGFLKKQFPKFIKGEEFVIPNEYLSNKTKLQKLVKILSDTSEQGQMAAVWNRAKGNAENPDPKRSATARGTLTILDHLNQRLSDIDNISESKVEKQRDWTVKMWDRNPQKDIFQGNYSTCCIAMGGGCGSAMPHFVMNTAYNMIEIVDNVSGKTVGNALCYFITGADGKPAFIVDNIEINNSAKPSNNVGLQLRYAIVQYAANVSKEVTGGENTPIFMSSSYNDVPCHDLPRKNETISFLGDIDCDNIYMDLYNGWVDKDEFTSEQELLRLK